MTETLPVSFRCNCSRDRCERGLILLGTEEIDTIIQDGQDIDMTCQFCGKSYHFSLDDIRKIRPRTFGAGGQDAQA